MDCAATGLLQGVPVLKTVMCYLDVFVVPYKSLRKTPVKKHGYVADEKRITSLLSKQLNINENTLMRCLTGETSQNFTFIQLAGFNAKPQFISQGRKKKKRR